MKNIYKLTTCFFLINLFISCHDKEKQKKETTRIKEIEINQKKFYYAKPHDEYWRFYQPNLEGAEGWITENCHTILKNSQKIKVRIQHQFITHSSWGYYKGSLRGVSIKTKDTIDFKYKCFQPDFSIGDWLIN